MENKNDKQNKIIDVQDMFNIVRLDILNSMSMARKLGYVTANMIGIVTEKKSLDKNGDIKSLLNIRSQWKARVEILEQITASREADKPAVGDANNYSMLWDLAKPPVAMVECYGQYYSSDDVKIFIKENAELKKENGKLKTHIETITEPIIAPLNIDKPAVKPAKESNKINHSLIDDWEPLWDRARLDLTMRTQIRKSEGTFILTGAEMDRLLGENSKLKKDNAELKKENGKLETNIEVIMHKMGNIFVTLDDVNDVLESDILKEIILKIKALLNFYGCIKGDPTPTPIITPLNIDTPDDGGD